MTKRLILIRHAKSGWDDPMMDDHQRVLTERGRKASATIGNWLRKMDYPPNRMLVSDAARTRETAELLFGTLGCNASVDFKPALYHASPDTILDLILRESDDTIGVIGHNPGIAMLAHGLVQNRPAHRRFSDYPTCATTVIDFDGDVRIGQGTCVDFIVPKDLG
ncbi:SixA phosphatase family protein [Cognatiyoonia sp.]|uniref:SixA phosphatase family protein n=1 Tax=Cognatiyoonia sp. TaxID=2211652 RepID=UPI003F696F2D